MKFEEAKTRVEQLLILSQTSDAEEEKAQLISDLLADTELSALEKFTLLRLQRQVHGWNFRRNEYAWNLGMTIVKHNSDDTIIKYISLLIQLLKQGIPAKDIFTFVFESLYSESTGIFVEKLCMLLIWYREDNVIQHFYNLLLELINRGISVPSIFNRLNNEEYVIGLDIKGTLSFISAIMAKRKHIDMRILVQLLTQYIAKHISFSDLYHNPKAIFNQYINTPELANTVMDLLRSLPERFYTEDMRLLKIMTVPHVKLHKAESEIAALTHLFDASNNRTTYFDKNEWWHTQNIAKRILEVSQIAQTLKQNNFPTPEAAAKLCEKVAVCFSFLLAHSSRDTPCGKFRAPSLNKVLTMFSDENNDGLNLSDEFKLFISHQHYEQSKYTAAAKEFDQNLNKIRLDLISPQAKMIFYQNICQFYCQICYNEYIDFGYHILSVQVQHASKQLEELRDHMFKENHLLLKPLNDAYFSKIQNYLLTYLAEKKITGTEILVQNIRKSSELSDLSNHISHFIYEQYSVMRELVELYFSWESTKDVVAKWLDNSRIGVYNLISAQFQPNNGENQPLSLATNPFISNSLPTKVIIPERMAALLSQLVDPTSEVDSKKVDVKKPASPLLPPSAASSTNTVPSTNAASSTNTEPPAPNISALKTSIPDTSNSKTSASEISALITSPLDTSTPETSTSDTSAIESPEDIPATPSLVANMITFSAVFARKDDYISAPVFPAGATSTNKQKSISDKTTEVGSSTELAKPAAANPASVISSEEAEATQKTPTSMMAPISDADLALLAKQKVADHKPEPKSEDKDKLEIKEANNPTLGKWSHA